MNHQKTTTHKIYPYLGLLLSGILFLFSFSRFYIYFREFNDLDESFTCLFYSEPSSAEDLAKECKLQGINCETSILFLGQNAAGTKSAHNILPSYLPTSSTDPTAAQVTDVKDFDHTLSISIVRGMKTLDYRKTEHLFQNSDVRIDVTLLKWLVYLMASFLFLAILTLFLMHFKKFCGTRWTYFFCLPLLLCYLKLEIFTDTTRFPVWILPGKWSDLEGFQALWENLLAQLSVISRFRDYPILCRYYQGLTGCPFYLVLCFLSLWVFLKSALFHYNQGIYAP